MVIGSSEWSCECGGGAAPGHVVRCGDEDGAAETVAAASSVVHRLAGPVCVCVLDKATLRARKLA